MPLAFRFDIQSLISVIVCNIIVKLSTMVMAKII